MNNNYKIVNGKTVFYDICYQLNFYGKNIKLNNKQQVYLNRDKAIIDMITFKDEFMNGLDFDQGTIREVQKSKHDLDGYLQSVDCFKNGVHVGMVQLSELEVIK